MGDNKTGLEKTLLLATSIVGGIVALFTALNGLFDRVKETSKVLSGFNEWQLGLASLALAAFSLWFFRLSRRRRSVLLRPRGTSPRAGESGSFGRPR